MAFSQAVELRSGFWWHFENSVACVWEEIAERRLDTASEWWLCRPGTQGGVGGPRACICQANRDVFFPADA